MTENFKKLSDHLVFRRNILTNRQLTILRLSGNCLDSLLMKGIVRWKELSNERNSDDRNRLRWQNPVIWKYGCYNSHLLGRRLTANLPNRGKHVTHDGQAPCPSWASTVPKLTQIGY